MFGDGSAIRGSGDGNPGDVLSFVCSPSHPSPVFHFLKINIHPTRKNKNNQHTTAPKPNQQQNFVRRTLTKKRSYKCYTESAFNFPGQACVSLIESSSTRTVIIASVTSVVEDELATLHPLTEAVNGYGVSIRYQLADFLITATATATATSTAGHGTAVLTSTATSTAAALPTQTAGFGDTVASAKHDSASQSLKIIVPIVIVALVLLSAALIWVCVRRSKRKARREDDGVNGRVLGELEGHGAMPRYSGMLGVGGRKEAGRVVHEFYAPPAEMAG